MLPLPATITHTDFRSAEAKAAAGDAAAAAASAAAASGAPRLRLCTWNIERGYCLEEVIEQLRAIDADIFSLQELDIGCDRSGNADTFKEIGTQLGLNGLFACEFEELRSPMRDARSQGGGVHGNAIFSRFDFSSWRVLEHSHHPIDWEAPTHPLAAKEPRKGRRVTLVADVAAPGGDIRVYCTHLEVFCGILGRVWQFSDILRDVKVNGLGQADFEEAPLPVSTRRAGQAAHNIQQEQQQAPQQGHEEQQQEQEKGGEQGGETGTESGPDHQQQQQRKDQQPGTVHRYAILGDLNTMANGIVRLSPNYCCDKLRWGSLGMSEARYWQRYVFSCAGNDPSMVNNHFMKLGLPLGVCRALVNPGFFDPFDPVADITLENPEYRIGPISLVVGKLDWALLKGLNAVSWRMGNLGWEASDHRSLIVEVE